MPWKATKKRVLECLQSGSIQYEARGSIEVRNLLATGDVTPDEVAKILGRARGNEHRESPHHLDQNILVHVVVRLNWYIKWYFLEPDAVFISVHQRVDDGG